MRRVFVSNSQPIRFSRFDNKSVNRGLPVLDQTRALDPCHGPEGSWALGTRMIAEQMGILCAHARHEWNNLSSTPYVIFERAAVGF